MFAPWVVSQMQKYYKYIHSDMKSAAANQHATQLRSHWRSFTLDTFIFKQYRRTKTSRSCSSVKRNVSNPFDSKSKFNWTLEKVPKQSSCITNGWFFLKKEKGKTGSSLTEGRSSLDQKISFFPRSYGRATFFFIFYFIKIFFIFLFLYNRYI